jgi:hypothetical protein
VGRLVFPFFFFVSRGGGGKGDEFKESPNSDRTPTGTKPSPKRFFHSLYSGLSLIRFFLACIAYFAFGIFFFFYPPAFVHGWVILIGDSSPTHHRVCRDNLGTDPSPSRGRPRFTRDVSLRTAFLTTPRKDLKRSEKVKTRWQRRSRSQYAAMVDVVRSLRTHW